jgi:hypothetical protein
MTDVIVEVLGGVVQNVAVNRKKVRVVLVDWDNLAASKGRPEEVPEWYPLTGIRSLAPETAAVYKRLLRK